MRGRGGALMAASTIFVFIAVCPLCTDILHVKYRHLCLGLQLPQAGDSPEISLCSHGSTELHTYLCTGCAVNPYAFLHPALLFAACLPQLLSSAHSLFQGFLGQGTGRVDTSLPFAMDKVGNCPETPRSAHLHYPYSSAWVWGHLLTSPFSATPNFLLLSHSELWPLRLTILFCLSCLHSSQLPSTNLCQSWKPSDRKADGSLGVQLQGLCLSVPGSPFSALS